MHTIRKFIAVLVLAAIPLQGVASMISVVICPAERAERLAQPVSIHDAQRSGAEYDEQGSNVKVVETDHAGCHPVVYAPPLPDHQGGISYSLARDFIFRVHQGLFLPELPKRPPRS
jgi:hypothetical protein